MDVLISLENLDLETAGAKPNNSPYSIYQLVNHMIFWQELFLQRLSGNAVPSPEGDPWPWPAEPDGKQDLNDVLSQFRQGLDQAKNFAHKNDLDRELAGWKGKTRYEALRIIASHNSYHAGQIILLRKMMKKWPPA